VTRGTKVASVMRINPLRVELTVPAQYIAAVSVGRSVSFTIDAYPGRPFEGRVRYVSPDVRTDSRALVVEAVVPNDKDLLKPGLFATAQIEEGVQRPGVLVPAAALRTVAGTTRVFVVSGDHVNESIISLGQRVGDLVEITMGLEAGAVVAISHVSQLVDGAPIVAAGAGTN
jgi:membrane fusion protein (multidrug efflux system)